MAIPTQRMTVADFDNWIAQQDNQLFEYIGGEIYEVSSNPYSSAIASEISYHIKHFLRSKKIQGFVTGEAGGYMVAGERYAPDVAFISKDKQEQLPYTKGYNPNPPDLAVEVVSPTDNERTLAIKVANYLSAGVVVWVIHPEDRQVDIFISGQSVQTLTEDDILRDDIVLVGFELAVRDIFPDGD